MNPMRIALCGPSGVGKTTIANRICSFTNVQLHSLGRTIKRDAQQFLEVFTGSSDPMGEAESFFAWCSSSPDCSVAYEEVEQAFDFAVSKGPRIVWTEDRGIKPNATPFLKAYGDYKFNELLRFHMASMPKHAIEDHLIRPAEAKAWHDNGGFVVLVTRAGFEGSELEQVQLEDLANGGLIDSVIENPFIEGFNPLEVYGTLNIRIHRLVDALGDMQREKREREN